MLIYIDLLFILNFWIDFLLLISTNIILKYRVNYKRVFLSSLVGAFSSFLFLINNDLLLMILKLLLCIVMQLIMNGFKGLKTLIENVFYFYLSSIILAGSIYLFKIDKINLIYKYFILIIITPLVLFINNKNIKKLDTYYKNLYKVIIIIDNKKYYFNALLDTGNNLYDQYKKRPISLVYNKRIKFDYSNGFLVPYETANKKSLLKCIKVDKIIIDNKEIKNAVVGLSDNKFNIQDINMILHKDIIGGLKWLDYY